MDQATWKRYRHQINRPYLICISGNSSWKDQAYIALLVPSLEYILSGKGLDCTDGLVPRGFDGLVLLYSLQGVPLYLYGYIDGVCKTTRKYSRRSGPETLGVWDKHCYWVSYGVIEPPTKSDPEWAAGAGSKKVCKSFYVPDESDLIPPIQVQRDYITDDELGEGGGGSNGDILGDSLEGLDPESLDFVKKAFELSESQEKIKETWEAMKRHVKDSTSRCEVGRWVYRTIDEQKKIKILFGKIHVGKPRSYESSLGAAMPNIPDDPLLNDISDPNAKPICFLHTHTPVRRGLRRTSPGLTDYDMRWAQSHKSKIAVIDYVITDSGHSIDGPFFIQIYDPIIDNSEWIRDIP